MGCGYGFSMTHKDGAVVWFLANWPGSTLVRLSGIYKTDSMGPCVLLDKISAQKWARVWKIHNPPRTGIVTGHKILVDDLEVYLLDDLQERLKRL